MHARIGKSPPLGRGLKEPQRGIAPFFRPILPPAARERQYGCAVPAMAGVAVSERRSLFLAPLNQKPPAPRQPAFPPEARYAAANAGAEAAGKNTPHCGYKKNPPARAFRQNSGGPENFHKLRGRQKACTPAFAFRTGCAAKKGRKRAARFMRRRFRPFSNRESRFPYFTLARISEIHSSHLSSTTAMEGFGDQSLL